MHPTTTAPVATPLRRGVTAREYFALPADFPRCELIEGELWMAPAPFMLHQLVLQALYDLLRAHARRTRCGVVFVAPVDVRFSDGTVLQPDIVFVSKGRLPKDDLEKPIRVVPDLCVEVVSGDSASRDLVRKRRIYERHGVAEYWVVDPREHLFAFYRLRDARYEEVRPRAARYRSEAVPRFTLPLRPFWREALTVP